jgi:hypothetical protein
MFCNLHLQMRFAAINVAVSRSDLETVKYLLAKGASVTPKDVRKLQILLSLLTNCPRDYLTRHSTLRFTVEAWK